MFSRAFEHLKNQEAESACMLPNVARYQLRHTPIIEFSHFIIAEFGALVKTGTKKGFKKEPNCFSLGDFFFVSPSLPPSDGIAREITMIKDRIRGFPLVRSFMRHGLFDLSHLGAKGEQRQLHDLEGLKSQRNTDNGNTANKA